MRTRDITIALAIFFLVFLFRCFSVRRRGVALKASHQQKKKKMGGGKENKSKKKKNRMGDGNSVAAVESAKGGAERKPKDRPVETEELLCTQGC